MDKNLRYFSLPNILTLFNLIAGSFALFFASELSIDKLYIASYFVLIALIFDFLDGYVARLTKSVSKIGKQLDSLADIVSFGVAPAFITFQMIKHAMKIESLTFDLPFIDVLLLVSPILLIIAAALRLAKFNSDNRQEKNFLGLAVPISAIFFISMPILYALDTSLSYEFVFIKIIADGSPIELDLAIIGLYLYILPIVSIYIVSIIVFSILQLVNIPMFSLKSDGLGFKKNIGKYIYLIFAAILFLFFQFMSLPFIVIFYILFSNSIAPNYYKFLKFNIVYQDKYSKGELLLRTFFGLLYIAIPHYFLLVVLSVYSIILRFITFWIILFTGKYPVSIFNFQKNFLQWKYRVNASLFNLSDGYPKFGLNTSNDSLVFEIIYPDKINKGLLFFRVFLGFFLVIIPHLIVLSVRKIVSISFVFVAFWVVLFTGNYPKKIHDFNVGTLRWELRFDLFNYYMTDSFPPLFGKEIKE